MKLGMIGLGRMGSNMVRRLMRAGHQCVVFDRSAEAVKALAAEGALGANSLDDPPRPSPPRRVATFGNGSPSYSARIGNAHPVAKPRLERLSRAPALPLPIKVGKNRRRGGVLCCGKLWGICGE